MRACNPRPPQTTKAMSTSPTSPTQYLIRADGDSIVSYLYYVTDPYHEHDIEYCWGTHHTYGFLYASEAEAAADLAGLPQHAHPKVITYEQAAAEHIGEAANFPFNIKSMLTDEEHAERVRRDISGEPDPEDEDYDYDGDFEEPYEEDLTRQKSFLD